MKKRRHSNLSIGPPKTGKSTFARWLFEDPVWIAYDHEGIDSVKDSLDPDKIIWVSRKNIIEHTRDIVEDELYKFEGKADGIVVDDLTFMSRGIYRKSAGRLSHYHIKHFGTVVGEMRDFMDMIKFNHTWASYIYISTVLFITDQEENLCSLPNVFGKDTFAPEIPATVSNVFFHLPPKKHKKAGRGYTVLTESEGAKMAGNRLSPAGQQRVLETDIDVTIYRDGEEVVNPIRDIIRPLLEGKRKEARKEGE